MQGFWRYDKVLLWFCNLLPDDLRSAEINIFYDSVSKLAQNERIDTDKLRKKERELFAAAQLSPEQFKSMVNSLCEKIEKARDDIYGIAPNEKVLIFGCGNIGKLVYHTLKKKGMSPACFADNNSSLWGTQIYEVPVISPQEACIMSESGRFVVANVEYSAEICSQLAGYGIDISSVIVCDSYDYTARRIFMGVRAQ